MGQSQIFLLVSVYGLYRHNLFRLRNYRNEYLMSVRQRLNFLPQGIGNAPSNATRDRMLVLTGKILTHMTSLDTTNSNGILPVERGACAAFLPNQPDAAPSSADCPSSQASSDRDPACAAISTLLSYLQNASGARSQPCWKPPAGACSRPWC